MEDQQKRAAFAILEYLKGFVDGKSVNEDEAESLSGKSLSFWRLA